MRHTIRFYAAAATFALGALSLAGPASAACTRLGFSVNDYGKDGPTRDAKQLLDKYIAKWAKDHNIAKYTTGKKDVTCELFLNLILFDEHTCKAEASVCWDGPAVSGAKTESAATSPVTGEKPAKANTAVKSTPVKATAAKAAPAKTADPVETGSTEKSAPKATDADSATGSSDAPAETTSTPSAN